MFQSLLKPSSILLTKQIQPKTDTMASSQRYEMFTQQMSDDLDEGRENILSYYIYHDI